MTTYSNSNKSYSQTKCTSSNLKNRVEKSRAKKGEVMAATKKGINRYRDTLKNLAKR